MNLSVRLPEHGRPRERLLRHGAAALSDAELLAIALRTGLPGLDVLNLGNQLLDRFSGLRGLLGPHRRNCWPCPAWARRKPACWPPYWSWHGGPSRKISPATPPWTTPARQAILQDHAGHRRIEHCVGLYLDSQLRLIASGELARGTLSQASVYPREVVREALRHHAAAVIIAHNHPSGLAEPSAADQAFTRHLKQALALVDVRLLDHLIVAGNSVVSMAECGAF